MLVTLSSFVMFAGPFLDALGCWYCKWHWAHKLTQLVHNLHNFSSPFQGSYLLAVLANVGVYLWERTHSVELIHMHARLLSQICIHVLVTDCWHFGNVWIVPGRENYRYFLRGERSKSKTKPIKKKDTLSTLRLNDIPCHALLLQRRRWLSQNTN